VAAQRRAAASVILPLPATTGARAMAHTRLGQYEDATETSTDYARNLLENGRARATADGLTNIDFQEADAEALPFSDNSFDAMCRPSA
jgi:ubiquinone/menaquinone biosynthesis C-methylase UbiE